MEEVACLFGHTTTPQTAFLVEDRLTDQQERWRIARCPVCGLLFLSPRPSLDEIGDYYPYESYKEEFAPAPRDEPSLLRRWNRRYTLDKLCHFVEQGHENGGRLLDLGCGTGGFLAQIRERGPWQVYGVDINEKAVAYARSQLDIDAFCGTLEDADYPPGFFDAATLWNVLEHLHDPRATLTELRRVLRPNGSVVLSIPNADSLDARLFHQRWVGFDAPRHLYTFSQETLQSLLSVTGFQMVESAHITGSYHSFVTSAQSAIQGRTRIPRLIRHILCTLLSSLPFHVLILPYLRIAEAAGRGAILTVRARPTRSRRIAPVETPQTALVQPIRRQ